MECKTNAITVRPKQKTDAIQIPINNSATNPSSTKVIATKTYVCILGGI